MVDHAAVVDATFLHRHGDARDLNGVQKMNARHDLAKVLLAGQYSHLTSELTKRASDCHDAEVNQWNMVLEDISSAEDVGRYVLLLFSHCT